MKNGVDDDFAPLVDLVDDDDDDGSGPLRRSYIILLTLCASLSIVIMAIVDFSDDGIVYVGSFTSPSPSPPPPPPPPPPRRKRLPVSECLPINVPLSKDGDGVDPYCNRTLREFECYEPSKRVAVLLRGHAYRDNSMQWNNRTCCDLSVPAQEDITNSHLTLVLGGWRHAGYDVDVFISTHYCTNGKQLIHEHLIPAYQNAGVLKAFTVDDASNSSQRHNFGRGLEMINHTQHTEGFTYDYVWISRLDELITRFEPQCFLDGGGRRPLCMGEMTCDPNEDKMHLIPAAFFPCLLAHREDRRNGGMYTRNLFRWTGYLPNSPDDAHAPRWTIDNCTCTRNDAVKWAADDLYKGKYHMHASQMNATLLHKFRKCVCGHFVVDIGQTQRFPYCNNTWY